MKKKLRFIIIDDDPYNNSICRYSIKKASAETEVIEFTIPNEGFEYIESSYGNHTLDYHTVLILDINMPVMSGWNFLEKYDKLGDHIKKQFTIYILTSSVNSSDREKALKNQYIRGFMVKPLTTQMIQDILTDQEK